MEDGNVIDFAEAKYRSEHPEEAAAEDLAMRALRWHLGTLKAMSINQEKFDNMEKCVDAIMAFFDDGTATIDVHRDALSSGGWGAVIRFGAMSTMDAIGFAKLLAMADGVDIDAYKNTACVTLTFKGVEEPIR